MSRILIELSPEETAQLRRLAEAHTRPVKHHIVHLIRQAIAEYEQQQGVRHAPHHDHQPEPVQSRP